MAKQPTDTKPTELLSPEQLVDLVADFIKECREKPRVQSRGHHGADEAAPAPAFSPDERSHLTH